ncbi:hypothetical protein DIU31_009050 [Mucilaginibacter rubeus]|uniref:Uncharacterized protein n=1 Tax=Mucilaginibacter rubeus TaxID=2027860 RepID=A0AAE6JDP6_9SPHI|nr:MULTISPECIES: hypothetical protein [Mucilaginibacter]QEM03655.1 hypothetical protein DIU31_009050 [Mucilaginibacter rubeus]QEM16266.1 hypothetical protein DIU38_009145 [Mucilaginibacter gossypii]QTE40973.1 hypothetical protein J3L19_18620 [Mucilaginibacter rubeus]QTE47576.1 hypothetical protein J3L21_18595 [Mucilaginibacter rubeus]QTE58967.1 hypothetical protein J3L23_10255 [Mucilaginibacter rubeus]
METSIIILQHIANESTKLGAISALIKTGHLKPYINKSQAFSIYGRTRVERWLNAGYIQFIKDGDHSAAWRLDRLLLEIIDKAEALLVYV